MRCEECKKFVAFGDVEVDEEGGVDIDCETGDIGLAGEQYTLALPCAECGGTLKVTPPVGVDFEDVNAADAYEEWRSRMEKRGEAAASQMREALQEVSNAVNHVALKWYHESQLPQNKGATGMTESVRALDKSVQDALGIWRNECEIALEVLDEEFKPEFSLDAGAPEVEEDATDAKNPKWRVVVDCRVDADSESGLVNTEETEIRLVSEWYDASDFAEVA